ncbi:DUF2326 domain-containing protein [Peribacillus sp. NPDC006672]|uniref:DUF2326 domain-containing protein n=1 Tax=Peribacillus sp. NPDC006672 TaxID=3390606 RepID=UPI003D0197A6
MLKEIRCEKFKNKKIVFHKGLNVVMGDNEGSNSIGKSTLLMIVDFIFGGDTYLSHNNDAIINLGHHEFYFMLEFEEKRFYFCRGTERPDVVFNCNGNYKKQEDISIADYRKILKEYYGIAINGLSFRSAVSLFSRVWGKDNYDVKKPLHTVSSEKNLDTITRLIKLFNQYEKIEIEDKEIKTLIDTKNVINKAGKMDVIPKINQTIYKKNISEIDKLQQELENLSKSVFSPAINISEIISDEILDLREKKKIIMDQRDYYKSRLNRTNKTISNSKELRFESLIKFFPDVNIKKLEKIEEFHEGISSILSDELKKAKKELSKKISTLEEEIRDVNNRIENILNPNEETSIYIDRLVEISSILKNLQLQNSYYKKLASLSKNIDEKSEKLTQLKDGLVNKIAESINSGLKNLYTLVHNEQRTPPILKLSTSKYEYNFVDNTGTGNAYANLIIFDLVIFTSTVLPFIIHDSFLFKNVEKSVVEEIIKIYSTIDKQTFIAIDVIKIYDETTQTILENKKVIHLDKDNLLFIADWRDNTK